MERKGLEIEHIKKVFHFPDEELEVLSDINFSIRSGEFISIVGASGCGKSTLLRLIAGLEKSTEGEIRLNDKKVEKPSAEVGFVFQESRLLPWLTVEENIAFGLHRKMSKEEQRELVQKYIDIVGLSGFEKARPKQLSGGMQQRASIARSLIGNPGVLLLDEPFGALDALTRINMQQEIQKIWEKEKKTMILVTHDIEEAIYLGDRVIIMSSRPGIIKREIQIQFPRPRYRTSPDFVDVKKTILADFFEDQDIQEDYMI